MDPKARASIELAIFGTCNVGAPRPDAVIAAGIGFAGWLWRDGDDMGALGGAIFGAAVMVVGHALLLWRAAG